MSLFPVSIRWGIVLAVLVVSRSTHAAVDMFLECGEKIKGETQDKDFKAKNAIDISSWAWGMSQSGTTHKGAGGGAGRATFQNLSFTKWVDKASTPLMSHLALGAHIPLCKLSGRKAGVGSAKYFEITMTECIVSSLSTGANGDEVRLKEEVTLNFAKVKVEYFQKNAQGSIISGGIFNWDIAGNAGLGGASEKPALSRSVLVPRESTAARLTLTYSAGDATAKLSWPSMAGRTYRVSAAENLDAPFSVWRDLPATEGEITTVDVPMSSLQQVFRVDVLP